MHPTALFITSQPYIESICQTRYQYLIPKEICQLDGIIMRYFQFYRTDNINFYQFPDCCPSILFFYDSTHLIDVKFKGANTYLKEGPPPNVPIIFGIDLFPGTMTALTHICAKKINDQEVEIPDSNTAKLMQPFIEKMRYALTFEERVATSQHFIDSWRAWLNDTLNPLRPLFTFDRALRVTELAKQNGYSDRQLLRLFNRYVGRSPKRTQETLQFRDSFQAMLDDPHHSLTELAWDYHYYDLSHMTRAYEKLSGFTPHALLTLILTSSTSQLI